MKQHWIWMAAVAIAMAAIPASATFHLYRIDQVFSNADGTVQYVVMHTTSNGESFWSGQVLTTTSAAGVAKQFSFPSNLPSSSTANRSVLIATAGFAALDLVAPDYTIPGRFIPTDGGTLNFAGVDQIALPAMPGDGATAINRSGAAVPATPRNFAGVQGAMTPQAVTSVEFYNEALDHYFISALAPDIDALETGRLPGWQRTGLSFRVLPSQAAGGVAVTPVCRIIIPPPHGDSHFFGRSLSECEQTLAKFAFMSQETATAFYITLPAVGACPGGTIPVYRVFSNRADANHRYTTDRAVRDQMAGMGWTIEGDGADFVVMCAPPNASGVSLALPPQAPVQMPSPGYGPPG